jgi:hypothetical protein
VPGTSAPYSWRPSGRGGSTTIKPLFAHCTPQTRESLRQHPRARIPRSTLRAHIPIREVRCRQVADLSAAFLDPVRSLALWARPTVRVGGARPLSDGGMRGASDAGVDFVETPRHALEQRVTYGRDGV